MSLNNWQISFINTISYLILQLQNILIDKNHHTAYPQAFTLHNNASILYPLRMECISNTPVARNVAQYASCLSVCTPRRRMFASQSRRGCDYTLYSQFYSRSSSFFFFHVLLHQKSSCEWWGYSALPAYIGPTQLVTWPVASSFTTPTSIVNLSLNSYTHTMHPPFGHPTPLAPENCHSL